jgi:cytochrome P450
MSATDILPPRPEHVVPDDVPRFADDPFGDEILASPWDFHHRMREAGPVVYLEKYDVYAVGRYAEVHAALTNWDLLQSSAGVGLSNFRYEKPWRPQSLLIEADPPKHDAPRNVLKKILAPRSLRRFTEQWREAAEAHVDRLLDGRRSGESVELDAIPAIAESFPMTVFPDGFGVQKEGREHLLPYGDHTFNAFGPHNHLVEKGEPTIAEHVAWVAESSQRDNLDPHGLGADIFTAADRGDITHEQAPLIVRSILTAGFDTTVHGIGAVLASLARFPDEYDRLRANDSLIRVAFDEAVRIESPVQTFFRTTTTDVEISGTVVPEGQKVLMFLGSANRDGRRWTDPDRFDLTRDPSGHVGFGMGIHQCIGQHVARLEAELITRALARRVSRLELTDEPSRHINNTLIGYESVPLRLTLA